MDHFKWVLVHTLLILCLASAPALGQGPAPAPVLDCALLPCGETLPGAVRFEALQGKPYQEGYSSDDQLIGWVVLSTDVVDIKAYSGKPLVTLLGLDTQGNITGVRVIHHSEPILLVGIPEKALHDFASRYVGMPATKKVAVGASPDPDAMTVDAISGATVTALAQNQTILDTARELGSATGVVRFSSSLPGSFRNVDQVWTWKQLVANKVFGRLTVTAKEMGTATDSGTFIDLWFTLADAPQVGRALLGDRDYSFMMGRLQPGEHLLAILGNGLSSFKGSGFVRGGIFDRVRIEQGLRSIMFRDSDYFNLPELGVADAPRFKEGAIFITRNGHLDPGAPFDLVFIGSRYDGRGGFSRGFISHSSTFQLPDSLYHVEGHSSEGLIWRQAWYNHRTTVVVLALYLLMIGGLFAARRWMTGEMARLKRLHTLALLTSFLGLGLWLRAQPSVTQVLTLVGSLVGDFRWGLFLSEPLLFIAWIFIAAVTLSWGRGVFCGWVCPYGAMSELLSKLGALLHLPAIELSEPMHRKAIWIRYAILFGLIPAYLYSPQLGERLAEIEPFKSTFFVAPWTREWWLFGWWLILAGASLVWYRPFCRYICPLGAALALPSSFRISGPHRRKFCESCTICTRGCEPRAIRPDGTIDSRECLSCMECEANYRDDAVCPPLVGLRKLESLSQAELASREIKLKKLQEQAEDV